MKLRHLFLCALIFCLASGYSQTKKEDIAKKLIGH
jgi:hypothetical protein